MLKIILGRTLLKKLLFLTLLLVSFFLLSNRAVQASLFGDWPMFRKDQSHTGFNSEEILLKPPLQVKWSLGSPGGPNSPAVSNGIVYIEFAGVLFARDAITGTLLWLINTPASDHSSVAVAYGMVFDGSGKYPECTNCGVVAYDAKTGIEKWRINLPMGARGPNVDNDVIYFGSDDHYVRAANAFTGEPLWTSPKLNDGIVAVPAVADGKVFVGTWGGLLYALNSTNGQILWQSYTGGVTFSSPSVVNNTVYVGSGTENVYAFDAPTGTLKWTYTGGKDSVWGSPAIAYGKLYIQDLVGHIHALDSNNGNLIWEYQTGAQPSSSYSSPAVANGVVYIGSQDKNIYAFDAYTGKVLWKYETGGAVNSSPAVSNGILYVGSNDGYIYAFGNEAEPTPTPTPTPTSIPLMGSFELPYSYPGRLLNNPAQFKSAFWDKMRALFDHAYQTEIFRPFTGDSYSSCTNPISCYDSHNGIDFSGTGNQDVYSVSIGNVVYTSPHTNEECTPEPGGFGCVVIAKQTSGVYGLYAHLDKINVNTGDRLSASIKIGEMGATGCLGCGEHLHFGVLKPIKNVASLLLINFMRKSDWQGLLYNIRPSAAPPYPPACTYSAPNGIQFSFQDPSGWRGSDKDPWSIPRKKGGCGINSPYLWKFDVGISP